MWSGLSSAVRVIHTRRWTDELLLGRVKSDQGLENHLSNTAGTVLNTQVIVKKRFKLRVDRSTPL